MEETDETHIPEVFEMFSGGIAGWYYGTWTGYYGFDKSLIHTAPPESPEGETLFPN